MSSAHSCLCILALGAVACSAGNQGLDHPDAAALDPPDAAVARDAAMDAPDAPGLVGSSDALPLEDAGGEVEPGTIAFTSQRNGEYDIFVANLRGEGARAVSASGGDDFHPAFRPDGRRLLFSRNTTTGVALVEVDTMTGTSSPIATIGVAVATRPAVSPDDCCLVFQGLRTGESMPDIYVLRRGMAPVRVTDNPTIDAAPIFSPDGLEIIFVSDRDGGYRVYAMALDGSGVRRETEIAGVIGRPSIAPDGSRIAFTRLDEARQVPIIVELDRTTGTEHTITSSNDFEPSYSPDGKYLVFGTARFGAPELMLLDLMSTAPARRITHNTFIDGQPTLAP